MLTCDSGAWRARSITDVRRFPGFAPPAGLRAYVPMVVLSTLPVVYGAAVTGLAWDLTLDANDWTRTEGPALDSFRPLALLTLPGSFGFPWEVVSWGDVDRVGVGLALIGLALIGLGQAGIAAALVWWRLTRRKVLPALTMVVGIVSVNLVAHDRSTLDLPDRSDPAVAAEETRIAAVVAASGEVVASKDARCKARLLAQRGASSWAMVLCEPAEGEGAMVPVRVRGEKVRTDPLDRHGRDGAAAGGLFPSDVARAIVLQDDEIRP